ncbi:hypothetical protein ACLB2K_031681 [Fragaria x ananassa]
MSETEFSKLKDMWASILVSRDLPVGISLPKFGHKTFGFEVYCPNLCARQFGLIQGIPTPPFFSLSTHFLEKASVGGFEEQLQGKSPFKTPVLTTREYQRLVDQEKRLDSHSQFLSEATKATFQKKTCPQSKHQDSDAVCVGLVVESAEDNIDFQVNDRPLTETMDASNDRLTSQISFPPTEAANPQTPQSQFHAPSSHPNPSGSHTICDPEVKIQSISTLPLDNVMETECLQSFKSSLETLVRSNDQTGVQLANIEDVLRKLAFLESKYPSASGIIAEVNKAYVQKLQLEHEVTEYTNRIYEAKKEEPKFLNCVDIQKSIVEELETKLAEEKASLIALEKYHATYKCKIDLLNYECEQSQQMLGHHFINERIWVNKTLQARSDFKSIEATWVQIQHLLSSIGGSKLG